MGSPVWAITGFKLETFDSESKHKVRPDRITGRLHETTNLKTIMHGVTLAGKGKPPGYGYLKASMQKMEDFENTSLEDRGLGAVSGGFISSASVPSTGHFTKEQEWGAVDPSKEHYLGGFYNSGRTKYNHIMVCFDRVNVAPVSGFWTNGEGMIGRNTQCDRTDRGVNFELNPDDTGSYAIALEKVESTIVLKVDFPELLADGATKTVGMEVMFSEVFTNGSPATVKDSFNMKTTLLDTHMFVFQEGLEVDWTAGWTANVPLLSDEKTTIKVEAAFGAHQSRATTKTRNIDRSAEITLPPMTGCKATARYMKTVLTVNAVLTVQNTYTNGAVQICKVPAKYTGVSCDDIEIKLASTPVVPPT